MLLWHRAGQQAIQCGHSSKSLGVQLYGGIGLCALLLCCRALASRMASCRNRWVSCGGLSTLPYQFRGMPMGGPASQHVRGGSWGGERCAR